MNTGGLRNHSAWEYAKAHLCSLGAKSRCCSNDMSLVMKKPFFAYAKTKTQISVTAKLISAFVFATRIVQSLHFLNPKFQASSRLLWLCSPVCVGPGRKPRRPVFSQRGSYSPSRLSDQYESTVGHPYNIDLNYA